MGDVHVPTDPPNKVGAKVQELIDSGHEFYASLLTGAPSGRVRRPTLFVIAGLGMVGAILGFQLAGVAGLIAMLLLALTDNVVEL